MKRLFFGVELDRSFKQQLAHLQQTLQDQGVAAGNWSAPELLHLTVLFLGEVDEQNVPSLVRAGAQAAAEVSPFAVRSEGVGVFERSRVLWVGVRQDSERMALDQLHQRVHRQVTQTGLVALDTRPFRPHITLARKLRTQSLPEIRLMDELASALAGGDIPVRHLSLFASTRVAGQLVYPVLHRFNLHDGAFPRNTTDPSHRE